MDANLLTARGRTGTRRWCRDIREICTCNILSWQFWRVVVRRDNVAMQTNGLQMKGYISGAKDEHAWFEGGMSPPCWVNLKFMGFGRTDPVWGHESLTDQVVLGEREPVKSFANSSEAELRTASRSDNDASCSTEMRCVT